MSCVEVAALLQCMLLELCVVCCVLCAVCSVCKCVLVRARTYVCGELWWQLCVWLVTVAVCCGCCACVAVLCVVCFVFRLTDEKKSRHTKESASGKKRNKERKRKTMCETTHQKTKKKNKRDPDQCNRKK